MIPSKVTTPLNKEKKILKLMNSSMMPSPGKYECREINVPEFVKIFRDNEYCDRWESYIGYPNCANVASQILGEEIPISRQETELEDGDEILVLRLNYRPDATKKAGNELGQKISDYRFFYIKYSSK